MKFELFKGTNGQWYWRFVAANGQVIAIGGEGYINRGDALAGIGLVRSNAATAPLYEQQPNGQWFKH